MYPAKCGQQLGRDPSKRFASELPNRRSRKIILGREVAIYPAECGQQLGRDPSRDGSSEFLVLRCFSGEGTLWSGATSTVSFLVEYNVRKQRFNTLGMA